MSATEEILEEALDVSEEMMDVLESTRQITYKHLILVGAASGAVGGVVAYFVGKKIMQAKYEKLAQQEIAEAKEFYSRLHKKDDFSTPEKAADALRPPAAVEKAADALITYQGRNDTIPHAVTVEKEVNVFAERSVKDNFDIEKEMKSRTPDKPYIISHEEFMLAEPGFPQSTITYYEGDGTLADERDQEIPFVDPVVGEGNLQFGYGSGDNRIVYIRNERLSSDYEVLKSDGKYAHEVLGFEHADGGDRDRKRRNANRKFRGGDE